MSPELLDPEIFDIDGHRTKFSDYYALGMVVWGVLSKDVPFFRYRDDASIVRTLRGERPERPQGAEVKWFMDDVWSALGCCRVPEPGNRLSIEDVLQCLEEASRFWTPLPPPVVVGSQTGGSPIWSLTDTTRAEECIGGGIASPN